MSPMTRSPLQSERSPARSAPRCSASIAERLMTQPVQAIRPAPLEQVVIFLRDPQLAPPQPGAGAGRALRGSAHTRWSRARRKARAADHRQPRPGQLRRHLAFGHRLSRARRARTGMATRAAVVKAGDACGRRGCASEVAVAIRAGRTSAQRGALVLEAKNLARHYQVGRGMFRGSATLQALRGASFEMYAERTLAVVGVRLRQEHPCPSADPDRADRRHAQDRRRRHCA